METITESENGEQQNAPGGGGDGGDKPSSNPRSGNVGPRGKEDIKVKENSEVGQVHKVHQVSKDLRAHKV